MKNIDLRSDTVTKPSEAMREAIAVAPVGDDVYQEDPTIHKLEVLGAEMTGKEASIFMASGTQGNIIALLAQCVRGDGVILGENSHIYNYERGGLAVLGGLMPLLVKEAQGLPLEEDVFGWCRPDNVHFNPAKMVCMENTHNRGGGYAVPLRQFQAFAEKAHSKGLLIHLDGARLWNAAVKYGVPLESYAECVDTVQLCLSKGLGAPVGSLLCGSREVVEHAREWRKVVGGGMRQAGILGAAGIYALENNFSRLEEDHRNAALLAELLRQGGLQVLYGENSTNMVFMNTDALDCSASELAKRCSQRGVLFSGMGDSIRYVTHLDVTEEDIRAAAQIILEEV
ncbi:MAG TPA: low-specificity L-threonine aldolase [Synergistaceae bacterium]|nr:low-specificity L-threonine aldolase [Synergistaceae bacterium]